jgi:cobalt-precorrin 5A hydrolase
MEMCGLDPRGLAGISSIDIKKDEQGLVALCLEKGLTLETFSAEALMAAAGDFTASDFVLERTGADNVCERAASLSSSSGTRLLEKYAVDGVTVSVYEKKFPIRMEAGRPEDGASEGVT